MICKWAEDSQCFIMGYFDAIKNSPSEIYYHALSFCPHSSWLHEHYNSELPGVRVVRGFQTTWGVCSRTVSFDDTPETLTYWKDIIAVGFQSGQIAFLDAVTGIQMSVLSGHTQPVRVLTFSLDGVFLVSGSNGAIKLWDIQTGGVIKDFWGPEHPVLSVSISMDNTVIASLYQNGIIQLYGGNTASLCAPDQCGVATSVSFSFTNPQLLMITSQSGALLQWNTDGPEYVHIVGDGCRDLYNKDAFSLDGTCFIISEGPTATVFNSDSGVIIAKLKAPDSSKSWTDWLISPDGKYVACGADNTIYVWDITRPDPNLVNTFIGHTGDITSILLSASLVSSSRDQSIKFWQLGAPPTEPFVTDGKPTPSTSSSPITISLQVKDTAVVLVNDTGVVRTFDLSTGLCKSSFCTPAVSNSKRDVQLIGDRVIFVWCTTKKIHIWDTKGRKRHQTTNLISDFPTTRLKISVDGFKVFLLDHEYLQVLSTQTGEVVGKVRSEGRLSDDPLIVDGSRVWVHFKGSQTQGWNFGILSSTPVPLTDTPPVPDRPHLDFINCARTPGAGQSRIVDAVTGKKVFQLPERFAGPTITQWDGRYLVAGYASGEILILDFLHMIPY